MSGTYTLRADAQPARRVYHYSGLERLLGWTRSFVDAEIGGPRPGLTMTPGQLLGVELVPLALRVVPEPIGYLARSLVWDAGAIDTLVKRRPKPRSRPVGRTRPL